MSLLTPAQMQALNQQPEYVDPRAANPLVGGILGASSSPFAKSLLSGPRLTDQGSEGLQAFVAQTRARNAQFGSGPVAQAPQLPELPSELQRISQFDDMNSRDQIRAFYADPEGYYARREQQGLGPGHNSNPMGTPQPVPQPIQQMQPISAPQSLGGQMGGGMTGPQFPGQGGGQGGIGSLLEPIQAQMIKQFNQQKVVPLLNNFEKTAEYTVTGRHPGMPQGYGGGMPQQRMTTMGPESFGREPELQFVNGLPQLR